MGRTAKSTTAASDNSSITSLTCICCGERYSETEFHFSSLVSPIFSNMNRIPICKGCIEKLYQHYLEMYTSNQCKEPEKKAVMRVCMALDIYYSDNIFASAIKKTERKNIPLIGAYLSVAALNQNIKKNYDNTLMKFIEENADDTISYDNIKDTQKVKQKTVRFFGAGFSEDDYIFLQEQYDDWTTRHECKTKAQEEVFKQICFTQLELLKATRAKQDTKDLTATFQKLLETANLQPKQNSKDAMSDTQTFGTLIDKWENTRPLPEIDEQLQDVDRIGTYVDVFFKGHLSKMMGLKNAFSNLYTKFIQKYTVNKPEYNSDDNSEVIFDAIFGNQDLE